MYKIDILTHDGSPLGVTTRSIYGEDGRLGVGGAETLYKIARFLRPIEIDPLDCITRLHPRPKNPTFRRGSPGEWRSTFSDEHKRKAELLLGNIIETLGYEL